MIHANLNQSLRIAFLLLLITSLLDKIVTFLVAPNLVHAHGELVVSMCEHCLKVKHLFDSKLLNIHSNCLQLVTVLIFFGLLLAKLLIELTWRHLPQTNQGHMHSFVVRVCSELILAIFVVQVGYVVVADARGLIVLASEEHT